MYQTRKILFVTAAFCLHGCVDDNPDPAPITVPETGQVTIMSADKEAQAC